MNEDMGDTGERRTPPTGPDNDSVAVPGEGTSMQRTPHTELVKPGAPMLDEQGTVSVRMAPSQVMRLVS
jgi:hypothetical protein